MPLAASAQSLEALAQAYRKRPSTKTRAPLERWAAAHPNDTEGALALLVLGSGEASGERAAEAIPWLRAAAGRLPAIVDYAAFYLAQALDASGDSAAALPELETVLNHEPHSPLEARAALLAGEVYLSSEDPNQAIAILKQFVDILPQPKGFFLLAQCLEASGDLARAASAYQRVYYEYPVTTEATRAATATGRIRRKLGRRYPAASPDALFDRVDRLIRARQHLTARKELQRMTTTLRGADRDRARVWLGKARRVRGHDDVAYRWLKSLKVTDPGAEAERLYHLMSAARGIGRRTEAMQIVGQLNERFPRSEWRLQSLISAGNMYLLRNDHQSYIPLYRACALEFREYPRASYCDWKVAWSHYIRRLPEARDLLRTHLRDFPDWEKATAAMYYLARLAEDAGDYPAARTYLNEIAHEYPNYYYAGLARKGLAASALAEAAKSAEIRAFLESIPFSRRRHTKDFEITRATQTRLDRARMLFRAGQRSWGESELRFGARKDAQGTVLAMELAVSARDAGDHGRSIRYIKGMAPGYLSVPLGDAPDEFWKLAFPMPYRDSLEKYSTRRELDVFFLAALIRQESEFDTRAVSRARAYGLTQVLPSTGRQLSRTLGIKGFRTSYLYRPEININMGTYYLRTLIDGLDGYTEAALAAYNAGRSRARNWLTWAEYREAAEFVETIPFSETRTYVQTVLRNANIYARLYGDSGNADD